MLLAIDAGNTRVKWAQRAGDSWRGHGHALAGGGLDELSAAARTATRIAGCNVAGPKQRRLLDAALAGRDCQWVTAARRHGGLVNDYQPPASLGADRWCALLALREQFGHGVVALAGTALTVDRLDSDGVFRGGLIVAGWRAQLAAVLQSTGLDAGDREPGAVGEPVATAAAIRAGAAHALAGAVALFAGSGEPLVIAGGDAALLAGWLPAAQLRPELVFDGIALAIAS